jgi:hypothetical protein
MVSPLDSDGIVNGWLQAIRFVKDCVWKFLNDSFYQDGNLDE